MKGLIPKLLASADKNSPIILTCVAVGGVVVTAFLAAKAVPKAIQAIEDEEELREIAADERASKEAEVLNKDYREVYDEIYEPISKKDRFKLGFKYFIPAAVVGGITVGCIVGSERVNFVRQAAMAASCEAMRVAYDDYRDHVREEIGKSKADAIDHKIHEEKTMSILEKNPITESEYAKLDVGSGAALFCDSTTGRRFVSTYEKVYHAVDLLNERLSVDKGGGEDWIGVNEFLHMCGDQTSGFGLYNLGFAPRVFEKRLDRDSICDPIIGEHNGHTYTIVYLNYDVDDKHFL